MSTISLPDHHHGDRQPDVNASAAGESCADCLRMIRAE